MKIKTQYDKYKKEESSFRCPSCSTDLSFENINSIVCENGHCFDLSKRGYINFIPAQHNTNYRKELFEYRRRIFEGGFYDEISSTICKIISEHFPDNNIIKILDAGSGEGFFAGEIKKSGIGCNIFCMDNLKDAVILGASSHKDIFWTVGDLTNIPLKSDSVDCITNIFAPSNYSEFSRILKEDGIIIKTVPGTLYLNELREAAGEQLLNKEYSNKDVVSLFELHTKDMKVYKIKNVMSISSEEARCFAEMTPLLINVDKSRISFDEISQITIECEILVGRGKD